MVLGLLLGHHLLKLLYLLRLALDLLVPLEAVVLMLDDLVVRLLLLLHDEVHQVVVVVLEVLLGLLHLLDLLVESIDVDLQLLLDRYVLSDVGLVLLHLLLVLLPGLGRIERAELV